MGDGVAAAWAMVLLQRGRWCCNSVADGVVAAWAMDLVEVKRLGEPQCDKPQVRASKRIATWGKSAPQSRASETNYIALTSAINLFHTASSHEFVLIPSHTLTFDESFDLLLKRLAMMMLALTFYIVYDGIFARIGAGERGIFLPPSAEHGEQGMILGPFGR